MSVKIRLQRAGSKKAPFYRVVVAESTSPRDGKFIEKIGTYNPMLNKENDDFFVFKKERIEYWIGVGAQPTERVAFLLNRAGVEAAEKFKKVVLNPKKKKEEIEREKLEEEERVKKETEELKVKEEASKAKIETSEDNSNVSSEVTSD